MDTEVFMGLLMNGLPMFLGLAAVALVTSLIMRLIERMD